MIKLSADMFSSKMWEDAQNIAISAGIDFLAGNVTNATLKAVTTNTTGELGYLIYYINDDIFDVKNILKAKGDINLNKLKIENNTFIYDDVAYGQLTYTKDEPYIRLYGKDYVKYEIGNPEHEAIAAAGGISAIMYTKVTLYYNSNISKNIINTTANIAGIYQASAALSNTLTNSKELENVLISLVQTIISKAVSSITEEMTTMVANYAAKHATELTQFPSNVTKHALKYFNENKETVADIMEKKGYNKDTDPNEANNKKNKKVKEFMDKMQKNVTKITNKMNSITTDISTKLNTAIQYAENGPDYILDIVNKELEQVTTYCQEQIDKQWKKDKKAYEEKTESYGNDVGQHLVDMWNKELEAAAEHQLQKLALVEKILDVQRDQSVCVAMSVLAAKTGVYIPPSVISVITNDIPPIPNLPIIS